MCQVGLPPPDAYFEVPKPYDQINPIVDHLIIIDRRADLLTPFLTPFTYEALIDLCIGIKHTTVTIPPSARDDDNAVPAKVHLSSADSVYMDIRNSLQDTVGSDLYEKAAAIQQTYQEKESLRSISDLNQFMKRFKIKQIEHTSVIHHVQLLKAISDTLKSHRFQYLLSIEDAAMGLLSSTHIPTAAVQSTVDQLVQYLDEEDDSPLEAYRLLCLLSTLGGSFNPKMINSLRTALCQNFGIEEMYRLRMMELAGLVGSGAEPSSHPSWREVATTLSLLDLDSKGTLKKKGVEDISYICAGYAPLSCRLVEAIYKRPGGWDSIRKVFDVLWGPTIRVRQRLLAEDKEVDDPPVARNPSVRPASLVFFVGGCTYAELTALRVLTKLEKRDFVVMTTGMINAHTFINQFKAPSI